VATSLRPLLPFVQILLRFVQQDDGAASRREWPWRFLCVLCYLLFKFFFIGLFSKTTGGFETGE
jgi:hypothetical protein